MKVASLKGGDTVSVIIPKRDRHAANQKRAPRIIIGKSSGLPATYRLLSEHGVLNKRFNASKLCCVQVKYILGIQRKSQSSGSC